jgi:hypothetical protein
MDEKPKDASENVPDVGQYAVGKLAEHLEIGVTLAHHCEIQAGKAKGDRLGPVYAAARLMRANAAVAEALATVGGIERRRRSIVERIQPPDPKKTQLNSHLQERKITAEERAKIYRRMNEHVEQSIRARMGEEGVEDSVSRLVRDQEDELARLEKQIAEAADD